MNERRRIVTRAVVALPRALYAGAAFTAEPTIEVWKSPSCGCCSSWVKHLQANGFSVNVNDTGNNAARAQLGCE